LLLEYITAFGSNLTRLNVFIQQSLQRQQGSMQASPAQRWSEVIDDHGMAATLGLGSLPRIIDDERIYMGNWGKGQCWPTGVTQSNRLAW
jgi:hypothetical protein